MVYALLLLYPDIVDHYPNKMSGTFVCRDSRRNIIDVRGLILSPMRTKKIRNVVFTISEEKVEVSRIPYRSNGTKFYNIGAMVRAEYEKRTLLLHARMKNRPYIYWDIRDNNGASRAGLFKIVGDDIRPYCSSDM